MIVATFDGSSSVIGYAVGQWNPARSSPHVIAAGLIHPKPKKGPVRQRIRQMAVDAMDLVREYGVTHVVVETPAPAAPRAIVKKLGKGGWVPGQATYGMAVGYLIARMESIGPGVEVADVQADKWTMGTPKARRAMALAYRMPMYAAHQEADKGLDMADAIQLLEWWLRERMYRV